MKLETQKKIKIIEEIIEGLERTIRELKQKRLGIRRDLRKVDLKDE